MQLRRRCLSSGGSGRASRPEHTAQSKEHAIACPPDTPSGASAKPAPAASPPLIDQNAATAIAAGTHEDPSEILGPKQQADGTWRITAFLPGAEAVRAIDPAGASIATLSATGADGLFTGSIAHDPGDYRFKAQRGADEWIAEDPYRFPVVTGAQDQHYFSEGTHMRLWEVLGARPVTHLGTPGTVFAVWAPNVRRASVVGDFNGWDGRRHVMRPIGSTGIREIFIPGLAAGQRYKFELIGPDGTLLPLKADPAGLGAELRPGTCSIITRLGDHDWADADWMASRGASLAPDRPVSIYEAHLASWSREGDGPAGFPDWDDLARTLVPYVREMGFTHLEALPISEHPFDGSWGYQPTGLFAPTARHGDAAGFARFVDAVHGAGLGLILDWVPGHFPTDEHGLARFDGTALYEHTDPREGYHPDWNTLIYNYGRREVANFLIANALSWLERFHVDALRVDAVASMLYRDYSRKAGEWVPNIHGGRENLEAIDFLKRMNDAVAHHAPGAVTIAEESTAWPGVSRPTGEGGLGFGYKWNMGWMNDTLAYMAEDPVHRRWHHNKLTFGLHYAFSERFILPLSHDEVVHGKGSLLGRMPGDRWQRFANLRAYYAFMWTHPGKKLLFMGGEFGQAGEWNHEASLDWGALDDPMHRGVQALVRTLNRLYREMPALYRRDTRADGFQWIEGGADEVSMLAWLRWGGEDDPPVATIANFTPVPRERWRIGLPRPGRWAERLNTDAEEFGGSGVGNLGAVEAVEVPAHGLPCSADVTLPPLGALILEHEPR